MKKWSFKIGDNKIDVSTEEDDKIQLNIPRFIYKEQERKPENHVRICLSTVEEIPFPDGTKCQSPQEHPVWINGPQISRLSWDFFREKPHMRIDYDLQSPIKFQCSVRSDYLPWAVSEKYFWAGIGLQYILLHYDHLIFHASYIKENGKGIIFIAPSGTGKSTQADLWAKYRGAEIMNGDKACVKVADQPIVYGVPFDGTSGICQEGECPLEAIVVLEQAKENFISRLPAPIAIQALFSNVFVDRSVPQEWNKALDLIINLIRKVPVFLLKCTPDEGAVETLENAMKQMTMNRV